MAMVTKIKPSFVPPGLLASQRIKYRATSRLVYDKTCFDTVTVAMIGCYLHARATAPTRILVIRTPASLSMIMKFNRQASARWHLITQIRSNTMIFSRYKSHLHLADITVASSIFLRSFHVQKVNAWILSRFLQFFISSFHYFLISFICIISLCLILSLL